MCNGKGYYEEVQKPEIFIDGKRREENSENNGKCCPLPSISQPRPHYQLEQLFKANDGKALSRMSDSVIASTVSKPVARLPPVHVPNSMGRLSSTKHSKSNITAHMGNLLLTTKQLDKHPEDVARLAAIKLNRSDWQTKKAGLEECLQLAHSYPDELEPHMSLVYRAISCLLHGHRPHITMFACQASREFFAHMRSTCRPEFDEIVHSLLARTADSNKEIRLYANDALDKMVTYIQTTQAVRPIVDKGPIHNNPLVRTATARLLSCVVALKTPNTILTHPHLRDTCKRIIETGALLLADSNINVRSEAKLLISRFMSEEEFESVYYAEVGEKLRKRVQSTFIDIKTKMQALD
ncbi:TOG array regulator of axonemal microtubules protein 2-like isoform X1 [Macrosteles quadrilineatus]|uniref:TOG array regulator of axonemal microtubules protein 2-like isoform X1 n=1 Tax=Macrosteles quadrilineatus TaxID=74068 RepID=UPI0023E3253B|nr:TOG array regulator of axonemal microtubules protein 2-like isoform X1 [Macrosteles quadrilineatus]